MRDEKLFPSNFVFLIVFLARVKYRAIKCSGKYIDIYFILKITF